MNTISHRGWWLTYEEKNTLAAFQRSVQGGYGTETDVRDLLGELVISHDPPERNASPLSVVLDQFDGCGLQIAVNVKADGLASGLGEAFRDRDIPWFAFDMSAPEMLRFATKGLPFYTRQSEIEADPILYGEASGVWLDSFFSDWFDSDLIARHTDAGKKVCVISPELHGRDPRRLWDRIGRMDNRVTLCTDQPETFSRMF